MPASPRRKSCLKRYTPTRKAKKVVRHTIDSICSPRDHLEVQQCAEISDSQACGQAAESTDCDYDHDQNTATAQLQVGPTGTGTTGQRGTRRERHPPVIENPEMSGVARMTATNRGHTPHHERGVSMDMQEPSPLVHSSQDDCGASPSSRHANVNTITTLASPTTLAHTGQPPSRPHSLDHATDPDRVQLHQFQNTSRQRSYVNPHSLHPQNIDRCVEGDTPYNTDLHSRHPHHLRIRSPQPALITMPTSKMQEKHVPRSPEQAGIGTTSSVNTNGPTDETYTNPRRQTRVKFDDGDSSKAASDEALLREEGTAPGQGPSSTLSEYTRRIYDRTHNSHDQGARPEFQHSQPYVWARERAQSPPPYGRGGHSPYFEAPSHPRLSPQYSSRFRERRIGADTNLSRPSAVDLESPEAPLSRGSSHRQQGQRSRSASPHQDSFDPQHFSTPTLANQYRKDQSFQTQAASRRPATHRNFPSPLDSPRRLMSERPHRGGFPQRKHISQKADLDGWTSLLSQASRVLSKIDNILTPKFCDKAARFISRAADSPHPAATFGSPNRTEAIRASNDIPLPGEHGFVPPEQLQRQQSSEAYSPSPTAGSANYASSSEVQVQNLERANKGPTPTPTPGRVKRSMSLKNLLNAPVPGPEQNQNRSSTGAKTDGSVVTATPKPFGKRPPGRPRKDDPYPRPEPRRKSIAPLPGEKPHVGRPKKEEIKTRKAYHEGQIDLSTAVDKMKSVAERNQFLTKSTDNQRSMDSNKNSQVAIPDSQPGPSVVPERAAVPTIPTNVTASPAPPSILARAGTLRRSARTASRNGRMAQPFTIPPVGQLPPVPKPGNGGSGAGQHPASPPQASTMRENQPPLSLHQEEAQRGIIPAENAGPQWRTESPLHPSFQGDPSYPATTTRTQPAQQELERVGEDREPSEQDTSTGHPEPHNLNEAERIATLPQPARGMTVKLKSPGEGSSNEAKESLESKEGEGRFYGQG